MTQERELQWDDQIEKDGPIYKLLPAGEYNFVVEKFERKRFAGSAKLPACNEASLTIKVDGGEHGEALIFHSLYLHTITEGFLSAFFTSIGQKKKDEKVSMNWGIVTGARGRCEVFQDTYKEKTNNKIKNFLPYEEFLKHQGVPQQGGYQAPLQQYQQPAQQQTYQQPAQQQPFPTNPPPTQPPGGGWTPGQL